MTIKTFIGYHYSFNWKTFIWDVSVHGTPGYGEFMDEIDFTKFTLSSPEKTYLYTPLYSEYMEFQSNPENFPGINECIHDSFFGGFESFEEFEIIRTIQRQWVMTRSTIMKEDG